MLAYDYWQDQPDNSMKFYQFDKTSKVINIYISLSLISFFSNKLKISDVDEYTVTLLVFN